MSQGASSRCLPWRPVAAPMTRGRTVPNGLPPDVGLSLSFVTSKGVHSIPFKWFVSDLSFPNPQPPCRMGPCVGWVHVGWGPM